MGPKSVRFFFPGLLFLLVGLPAFADDSISLPGVRVDVFGGWAWGETTESGYLDATPDGEAERGELGVALRHDFSKSFKVFGQFELSQRPGGESEAELDFLFFEWRPSERQTWRLGRGKQPFGIYSEFYDLGTDRPFYDLPQGLYGPSEIVAESLDGISYMARWEIDQSEARLELYAGEIHLEPTEPWGYLEDNVEEEDGTSEVERTETLGLRAEWQSRRGFTLGFSAFRGKDRHHGEPGEDTASALGVHAFWEIGNWLIRAEGVRFKEEGHLEVDAAYLETARRFGPHWQVALRWDRGKTEVLEVDLENFGLASLGEHRDAAASLNYWFHPGLVLKLSHHRVEGRRFLVSPEGETTDEEIGLWRFGVQFAY